MYVDMHAHVLPGADHGSESLETSLKQLHMAVEAGVDTVVATPHFYMHTDRIEDFLPRRERCFDLLCEGADPDLRKQLHLVLGAEVTLEVDLDNMEGLEKLCIGDTRNILIELPFVPWTPWIFTSLRNIIAGRGLRPIIAHVDRYLDNPKIDELLDMDLPLQINAAAIDRFSTRRQVRKLFEKGMARYVGSDIHGTDPLYYRRYSKAMTYLKPYAEEIDRNARIAVGQQKQVSPFKAVRLE